MSVTDISEFMNQEHHMLNTILADFLQGSDSGRAKELLSHFEADLLSHIAREEDVLFPSFEERTNAQNSTQTTGMRVEHQRIKYLLQSVREAVDGIRRVQMHVPETGHWQTVTVKGRVDRNHVDGSAKHLLDALVAHQRREEQMLYVRLDHTLEEEERLTLLNRIQSPHPNSLDGRRGS